MLDSWRIIVSLASKPLPCASIVVSWLITYYDVTLGFFLELHNFIYIIFNEWTNKMYCFAPDKNVSTSLDGMRHMIALQISLHDKR